MEGVGGSPDVEAGASEPVLAAARVEHRGPDELHVADAGLALEGAEARRPDRLHRRARPEQHHGEAVVHLARPVHDAEAALPVPGGPAHPVLLEDAPHVRVPAQSVGPGGLGESAPLAAVERQPGRAREGDRLRHAFLEHRAVVVRVSPADGVHEVRGQAREVGPGHDLAGVPHRALELPRLRPARPVVGERHGRVEMEAQEDVRVPRRNPQRVERVGALPAIRSDHQRAPRLQGADRSDRALQEAVPLFGIVRHRLVHELVGDLVEGPLRQSSRELAPQVEEALLGRGVGPQGLLALVEVVGAQDVEVHDRAQPVLRAPVERGVEEPEGLLDRASRLVEQLLLVHRDPQVVEAELRRKRHVLLREEAPALLAPPLALGEPVRDVRPAPHGKAVRRPRREGSVERLGPDLGRGDGEGEQCESDGAAVSGRGHGASSVPTDDTAPLSARGDPRGPVVRPPRGALPPRR